MHQYSIKSTNTMYIFTRHYGNHTWVVSFSARDEENHGEYPQGVLQAEEKLFGGLILLLNPADRCDVAFLELHNFDRSYLDCLRTRKINLYSWVVMIHNKSTLSNYGSLRMLRCLLLPRDKQLYCMKERTSQSCKKCGPGLTAHTNARIATFT